MIEGYSPWHTDENKRYCLMDTMDIVAVYRKVPDIVEGVRAVLEGITLVIIPNAVAESAGVCKELSGKEWDDLKTLESDIEEGVRELGVPVEFAFPPDGVLSEATARYSNADSDGAGLSLVDTILLCIAARMANVDVMTEDKALRSAIEAECGTGRTCTAREKYQKRNGCTAWFIGVVTGNDEPWWQMRDGKIEYLSGDSSVAVLEVAGDCWGVVRECSIGKPGAAAAIGAFYQTALLDDYCPCGSSDGRPFKCMCIGNYYGDELDCGLEKDEAWKFLQYLPGDERDNRLCSISVIRHAPAGSNLVRSTILNSAIMPKIADLIKFNSTET